MANTQDRVILPQHSHPLKYEITLSPDLERFTFAGNEAIDVEITEPTATLSLNAADLEVQSASVTPAGGGMKQASDIRYNEEAQTVTFDFREELPTGRAKLELSFSGELNDRLHGFYRSTYQPANGETRVLAATQFEPTDARRAFPCWDEPNKKATFDVTLVIPSHLTAVCNTSIASESAEGSDKKRVQFAETPPMSTYLLAFVVGELESIEDTADSGTLLRIWTTPGKSEQGRFALETAKRLLAYYNEYFGVPYPLEKLDQLAIPDFAAGAMENWGAITYREVALLFDAENSSPRARQLIAEVVAHEMAHMWFGDLVTMDWWNDLWLNESFASWMATKAVDHLYPEWDLWTQFVSSDVNAGLGLDGLESSHPIEQEVKDPAEINQLFDAISYQKGSSILRMLEQFLGPEQFRKGLRRYISEHLYKNATGNDLWSAMQEETGQPVVAMMESWINQVGYPVLNVDVNRADTVSIGLTQQRFLYSGPNQDPTLWQIPVRATVQGMTEPVSMVMSNREAALEAQPPHGISDFWVKVNSQQTGFYRVQYKQEDLTRLIPAVESLELPTADRLGLQADAYALARAGLVPATRFLDLARAYGQETEYPVWADLTANLRGMASLIAQEPYYQQYQEFGRGLLSGIAHKVGWEKEAEEGHLRSLLRSTVLGQMGAFGDREALEEAQQRFHRYLEDPSSLSPDMRGAVYNLAAYGGDGNTYTSLQRLHDEADLQEEKVRLLMAMSSFQDQELLEKTIEMTLSEKVRSQDSVMLVNFVASNRKNGREIAWDYAKRNWQELDRRYGAGGFAMMRLVQITGGFTTPEARQEVEEFFQEHPTPSASRTIQQSLERIGLNIRWLEQNKAGLAEWFGG